MSIDHSKTETPLKVHSRSPNPAHYKAHPLSLYPVLLYSSFQFVLLQNQNHSFSEPPGLFGSKAQKVILIWVSPTSFFVRSLISNFLKWLMTQIQVVLYVNFIANCLVLCPRQSFRSFLLSICICFVPNGFLLQHVLNRMVFDN